MKNGLKTQNQKLKYGILSYCLLDYIPNLCKRKLIIFANDFAKVWKLNWFLLVRNYNVLFQQKIHMNTFPRLSISLFVLAVMLVMLVRFAGIWQPEYMNALVRIRNLIYINNLCHPLIKNKGIPIHHMAEAHFK